MRKNPGAANAEASHPAAPKRMTRSSTLTTRKADVDASIGESEMGGGAAKEADASTMKTGAKGKKRDAESMEGPRSKPDRDRLPQDSSAKRAKTAKRDPPYLNPFVSEAIPQPATIPEPALSVANHEAHSQLVASILASTPPSQSYPPESDGRSPFQVSLSVKAGASQHEKLTAPPNVTPKLPTFKAPISTSSKAQTPRPLLALPPLPAKSKSKIAHPTPRSSVAPPSRSSVAPLSRSSVVPPSRPFLAARLDDPSNSTFSAASSSVSTEPPIPSTPALEKQSVPAPKASKQIVHLISELTGRVERLERENKVVMQSEVKLKAQCETLLKENTGLTKQVEKMDAELWGLNEDMDEQKMLVASILGAIEGLKSGTGAGNVVLAAKKVQKATDNNAFNVSS